MEDNVMERKFGKITLDELKEACTDDTKIQHHLDAIEYEQTREIDFSRHM